MPSVGAVLFSAGIALSVWLRQFGDVARVVGRTIAITMLVVPVHTPGTFASTLLLVAAGVVALLSTTVVSRCAVRLGIVPELEHRERPPSSRSAHDKRPTLATRMALQMLTALALAFSIGLIAFPAHWSWIVLTAFIVCSGALGRGDALYIRRVRP